MKTKLTVTIDEELIPRAKRYARGKGMSLSSLIERDLMRDLASESPFSQRWRGKLTPADKDEARYRRLIKKHA
jgi:hypothetical protein